MAAQLDLLSLLLTEEAAPIAAPVSPVSAGRRHYYRCCDCLTVAASDVNTAYHAEGYAAPKYGTCGACGGQLEYMGEVQRDRLVKHGMQCACDFRCTGATGPCCDCRCGGANHGTGLMVPVTYDEGGVPKLGISDGKGAIRGRYFRELCAEFNVAWKARYGAVRDKKREGQYLDSAEWARYREGGKMLERFREVKAGRVHAHRVKHLAGLIAQTKGGC